ncbi:hypothetical protein OHA98_18975 [Streptomyces sp. NBC_00654]|uniref:hypothetical protein n=1 Tax=Streptomyces sp. NBC_00654 TaxID=2975799 RepID=UPI0022528E96|nr:hypothetical protein [Streptomyces sp. NBC_00654]MCX4966880.1 hypothetical protein [Streptomyces sp. NBC_00654]
MLHTVNAQGRAYCAFEEAARNCEQLTMNVRISAFQVDATCLDTVIVSPAACRRCPWKTRRQA